MKQLEAKHPRAIRWFHWINFPLLSLMIWSGMLIYWAHPVYRIGIGSFTLFHFFPAWFYDALGIPYRLAEGIQLHFFFMWFFALNGIAYVLYTVISGEWRIRRAPGPKVVSQFVERFRGRSLGIRLRGRAVQDEEGNQ